MSISLNPYIYFNGQAAEAIQFYHDIFGGELTMQKFSEMPDVIPGGVNDNNKDWLMHGKIEAGGMVIMVSDTEKASPEAKKIELSIVGDDELALREIFGKLSVGGKVNSPLEKMYWGDVFGNLTDKYEVTWMVDILAPKTA